MPSVRRLPSARAAQFVRPNVRTPMSILKRFWRTEMIRITALALGLLALLPAKSAFAQAADTPYQVTTVTNDLTVADTLVALSNSGASSTVASPQNGQACVNVYAMQGNGSSAPAVAAC